MTDIAEPLVSVIIPTYNRAQLVRESIASVLDQTYRNFELIVADDGSTDGTVASLRSLTDARVKTIALDHTGNAARTRNRAVVQARGPWIAFLDSDDLWLPAKLELQLGALLAAPQCGWSCTGFGFIDANGTLVPQRAGLPYRAYSGWILERILTFEAAASIQTLMMRRTLLDAVGGFDEAFVFNPDYDLELRLAARSEICALPDCLTLIRSHDGRQSDAAGAAALFASSARVFRKARMVATSDVIRDICTRQCATQLAARARALSKTGQHVAAFASISDAMREAPFQRDVWRALANCSRHLLAARA